MTESVSLQKDLILRDSLGERCVHRDFHPTFLSEFNDDGGAIERSSIVLKSVQQRIEPIDGFLCLVSSMRPTMI